MLKNYHLWTPSGYCLAEMSSLWIKKLDICNTEPPTSWGYWNLCGISDYIRRYPITYPNLPNNNLESRNSRFVVIPNLPNNIFPVRRLKISCMTNAKQHFGLRRWVWSKKNHPFRSGRFVGEQTLKNCVFLFKNFNSFNVV